MSEALSLVCGDCGRQLKSAVEAKEHAEEFGHINFSESSEAILKISCQTCGKNCRTQTEKDLHTQRTGHTEFVDKTSENSTPVSYKDPEPQEKMDVDTPSENEVLVKPQVNTEILEEMKSMGFGENRSIRALYFSGNSTLEGALNWLESEGQNLSNLDEELLVSEKKANENTGPKLSQEEAALKAKELLARAKQIREQKEQEQEKEREKSRLRQGAELTQARKEAEETERKLLIEQKKREKIEEQRQREKVRAELEKDRAERMSRFGIADTQKQEIEKFPPQVKSHLRTIIGINNPETSATALKTILIYFKNILDNPNEEKYKKILKTNKAFQSRIVSCKGAIELLKVSGFEESEDCYQFTFLQTSSPELTPVQQFQNIRDEVIKAQNNPFYK